MDKRHTLRQLTRHMTRLVWDAVFALKFKPGMGLGAIEAEYSQTLTEIMTAYLESERPITAFRYEMRRAANDAMTLAGYAGYADGGGSGALPDKVVSWIGQRIDSEMAFINDVFSKLKELRKQGTPEEGQAFIGARAEGYTASLQGVYNFAKMQSGTGVMGVWRLGATEEHCDTCAWLNGKVERLQWFVDNKYIPRQAGSQTLDCGGWRCDCGIFDVQTGKQLV